MPANDSFREILSRIDREIEALLQQVPYGMLSGWSSYEDGMSSELQDVTLKIR